MTEEEIRRWATRLAAPLAFFLGAIILIVLVQRGLDGSADTANVPTLSTPTGSPTTGEPGATPAQRRFYRVRRGDTLESIAARFDTTVDDLLTLNPDIDPLALSPGQRVRVS